MSKHSMREQARYERIEAALTESLNAAAPDSESWTAGWDAFWVDGHSTLNEQLEHALNAAAPDSESWTAGWDKFHELYIETPTIRFIDTIRGIPSYFVKRRK